MTIRVASYGRAAPRRSPDADRYEGAGRAHQQHVAGADAPQAQRLSTVVRPLTANRCERPPKARNASLAPAADDIGRSEHDAADGELPADVGAQAEGQRQGRVFVGFKAHAECDWESSSVIRFPDCLPMGAAPTPTRNKPAASCQLRLRTVFAKQVFCTGGPTPSPDFYTTAPGHVTATVRSTRCAPTGPRRVRETPGFVIPARTTHNLVHRQLVGRRPCERSANILKGKSARGIYSDPADTVFEAIAMMAEKEIGALLVMQEGQR